MYKNSLNTLIDAAKNKRIAVPDNFSDELFEKCQNFCDRIPTLASSAMCFLAKVENIHDCNILPEILRLPFLTVWFEIDFGGSVGGMLCHQLDHGIEVLMFGKVPERNWVLMGHYKLKPQQENVNVICDFGGLEDVHKQGLFLFAQFLSALNCCNIKRIEHKPKPSQQSVRRALGRHPLFSTWTLEIDLVRSAKEIPGEGGTHASPRLHLRRGHARQHKPGHWCWVQAHVVGDKALGMIHKDYAVN